MSMKSARQYSGLYQDIVPLCWMVSSGICCKSDVACTCIFFTNHSPHVPRTSHAVSVRPSTAWIISKFFFQALALFLHSLSNFWHIAAARLSGSRYFPICIFLYMREGLFSANVILMSCHTYDSMCVILARHKHYNRSSSGRNMLAEWRR